jgi:hypothetical protein
MGLAGVACDRRDGECLGFRDKLVSSSDDEMVLHENRAAVGQRGLVMLWNIAVGLLSILRLAGVQSHSCFHLMLDTFVGFLDHARRAYQTGGRCRSRRCVRGTHVQPHSLIGRMFRSRRNRRWAIHAACPLYGLDGADFSVERCAEVW